MGTNVREKINSIQSLRAMKRYTENLYEHRNLPVPEDDQEIIDCADNKIEEIKNEIKYDDIKEHLLNVLKSYNVCENDEEIKFYLEDNNKICLTIVKEELINV